jgi:hypothetical protein
MYLYYDFVADFGFMSSSYILFKYIYFYMSFFAGVCVCVCVHAHMRGISLLFFVVFMFSLKLS